MTRFAFVAAFLLFVAVPTAAAQGAWFRHYQNGESHMKNGRYQDAALSFLKAIQVKGTDNDRERLSGMRRVPYFPRRELGICLYHLGIRDFAREELIRSIRQSDSRRARTYLGRL